MKKVVRRTLVVAGLICLPVIVLLGTGIYRVSRDLKSMTPVETKEIVNGVFSVRDSIVNLYLVRGAHGYVAFDAGSKAENIRTEMLKLNIDPAGVVAVFLTHADSDHSGGLPLFRRASVYLSTDEEQMVDGRKARFLMFKNKLTREHALLKDNETVLVDGVSVTAILTPGHTTGSACYRVDGQYLFTGDSMSLRSGKAALFSRMINMDNAVQTASLRKLAKLRGIRYLFTAHFGYSDAFENAMADFRE